MHNLWKNEALPHFITSVTRSRDAIFRNSLYAQIALEELHGYANRYDILLIAAVIMPDHIHCIIMPQGGRSFIDYVRGVKSFTAKRINALRRGQGTPPITREVKMHTYPNTPMSASREPIWQESFFDYVIETEEKLEEKIWYIIRNPVEDNLVAEGDAYPHLFVHPDYDPRQPAATRHAH